MIGSWLVEVVVLLRVLELHCSPFPFLVLLLAYLVAGVNSLAHIAEGVLWLLQVQVELGLVKLSNLPLTEELSLDVVLVSEIWLVVMEFRLLQNVRLNILGWLS